jgi:hypothetical protein
MVVSAKIAPARASARPEQLCDLRPVTAARIVRVKKFLIQNI